MWPFNKRNKQKTCYAKNIWKNIKCEYLRDEIDFGICPQDINFLKVYAYYQICIVTGERRIIEKRELLEVKEFELKEYFTEQNKI